MAISSPRLRRLDNALTHLPADSDAMLLSELDGYLAGVIVCPEAIAPGEWLPMIWGEIGDTPLFEDEQEARWYAGLVVDHRDALLAALAKGAGRYVPFLEMDPRHGEVMWELWIEGFGHAMTLRPESWGALASCGDEDVAEAFAGLVTLVEIARDESELERAAIDRLTDEAPGLIPAWIDLLHGWRARQGAVPQPGTQAPRAGKIGRNDPCPCGSGRKHKRCCAAN